MAMRILTVLLLMAAPLAVAADKKPEKGKQIDLGLPKSFGAIPTGEGLEKPKEKSTQATPSTIATDAVYSIVRVAHGKSFMRTPEGAKSATPYEQVATDGNPPTTEKFSTVVRVKATQKTNASIDVVILDPRGDTLMEASGQILFHSIKEMEADWTVDWERTPLSRGPGVYQVLVRVAGQALGTFPLKIAEPPAKK